MMEVNRNRLLLAFALGLICATVCHSQSADDRFVSFIAAPSAVSFYWKDNAGKPLRSIHNLKLHVEGKGHQLKFAMNGGMYKPDNSPQGLYIENNVTHALLDTLSGGGNFYMKPNGVFYITDDGYAVVCTTPDFKNSGHIRYATQSGPMLVIDGDIHPAFKKGSPNLNIRNGVGILPDGNVMFVISKEPVNFYDFALYFKSMDCSNALYLDGFVSRAYIPDKEWKQMDGNFGVMIGVEQGDLK